jgi:hypothetical protein
MDNAPTATIGIFLMPILITGGVIPETHEDSCSFVSHSRIKVEGSTEVAWAIN